MVSANSWFFGTFPDQTNSALDLKQGAGHTPPRGEGKIIVSINQPYWIPYLGYFALIASSDKFVVLDSVNFNRRSWVARNLLHIGDEPVWNSIPVQSASQNSRILDLKIEHSLRWKERTLRTLRHSFKATTINTPVFEMVESWFSSEELGLSTFLTRTLNDICLGTGIRAEIVPSDTLVLPEKHDFSGQERIIEICRRLGANSYVNLPSGSNFYDEQVFDESGISLSFLPELRKETESGSAPFRSVLHHLLEVGFDGTAERIVQSMK